MDRGDAAVFMLLSEHDSLEAQYGRQGDICLTVLWVCVYECVSVCVPVALSQTYLTNCFVCFP